MSVRWNKQMINRKKIAGLGVIFTHLRSGMSHVDIDEVGEKQAEVWNARQFEGVHVFSEIHPVVLVAEYLG